MFLPACSSDWAASGKVLSILRDDNLRALNPSRIEHRLSTVVRAELTVCSLD